MNRDIRIIDEKIKFLVDNKVKVLNDDNFLIKIFNKFQNTVPKKLYHYKKAKGEITENKDNTYKELINRSLFLSNPKIYNDPFDSYIGINNTVQV